MQGWAPAKKLDNESSDPHSASDFDSAVFRQSMSRTSGEALSRSNFIYRVTEAHRGRSNRVGTFKDADFFSQRRAKRAVLQSVRSSSLLT
jgi:hypothetical protein